MNRAALCFASGAALLLLVAVWSHSGYLAHDAALYAQIGERLAAGGTVYVDLFELNPPWVMWLNGGVAAAAGAVGLPTDLAVQWMTLALVWGAGVGAAVLLREQLGLPTVAVGFAVWCLTQAWHFGEWAQREQWFVCGYLLYTASRSRHTPAPLPVRLAIGVAVGVFACLKPHFVVIAVLVEAGAVLVSGTGSLLAAETAVAASVGLLYGVALLAMPTAAYDYLFHQLLPLLSGYGVLDGSPFEQPVQTLVLVAAPPALLAVHWRARHGEGGVLGVRLGLWATAAMVMYLAQWKFWSYHQIPVLAPVALGSLLWVRRAAVSLEADARVRLVWISALAAGLVTFSVGEKRMAAYQEWRALGPSLAAWVEPGDVVQIYTADVTLYHALADAGIDQTRAYMWDYPVALEGPDGLMPSYVDTVRRDIARDPEVIVVYEPCACGRATSMTEALDRMGVLSAIAQRYDRVADVASMVTVYRRRATGS